MRPIRAFLFARTESGQWGCQVFRDFEPLIEATIAANGGMQCPVGLHVGFERPDTEAVAKLLSRQAGMVFLSNGAIGTMPAPVRASHASIGEIGDTSFHAAVNGFGYLIEHADTATLTSSPSRSQTASNKSTGQEGWVASLAQLDPDLSEKLYGAGIWNEDTYLLREIDLDLDTRYVVGLRRYEILEGENPASFTLVDHLKSAPPWLLEAPIKLLNLSVRSENVCAANEIEAIGDFAKYGFKGLYKLPNLGQKSIDEISREMVKLFTTGHPLKTTLSKLEWAIPEPLEDIPRNLNDDSQGLASADRTHSDFGICSSMNITDGFLAVAKKLERKLQVIWFGRIGFYSEPKTLQQIADQIGVTRERVRQLEVKIYKKIHVDPFWAELSQRVKGHLHGRTSPLFLNGVSAIDPWFEGADKLAHPLQEITNHFPSLGFHILTWKDSHVISLICQAQWLEAISEAKRLLIAIAEQNLNERDVLSQVGGTLFGKGEDMREALEEEISKLCVWSSQPDGSRILASFGKSMSALVSSLLQSSDTPLHIDEILRRVRAFPTYETANLLNVRRAASEIGVLFGRGVYGLFRHCPLDPSQVLAIQAEVEDIISGGSSSKQWHSNELHDELLNRGFSYDGKLTKYIVNMALASSPNLVYLRRMIWGVRGKWSDSADARLDVKQAIVSLLEEEGRPMSTAQIRSKLIEGRGLNIHFQIWALSPLVRVGPGVWGLEGRDVDMQRASALAYRLLRELSSRQEGMHVTEAALFLGLSNEDEVSMLGSIGSKDGLRMDKGQYCYLQAWGESRRVSVCEAAISALKDHPQGLPKNELHLYVERIAKRRVTRQQMGGILQNIDAIYDAESELWKFAGLISDDIENSVDA